MRRARSLGAAAIALISDDLVTGLETKQLAVVTAGAGFGKTVSPAPANTVLVTLVNELTDADDDVFLFLDDYHWIANPGIHSALEFLLQYAPRQFHLVLTSRSAVPLPLARLRTENQLVEMDGSALRFDREETQNFLEHENLCLPEPADVAIVNAETEGWPAMLRIVTSTSSQSRTDFDQHIRRLSG